MAIRVIRLGSPRLSREGPRFGTVRRPPRGVRKADFSRLDYFDLWLPDLAPSAGLVSFALSERFTPKRWAAYAKRYRSEMRKPAAERLLALLAIVSKRTDFSVGCYCEDESRCHRSLLKELLLEKGASVGVASAMKTRSLVADGATLESVSEVAVTRFAAGRGVRRQDAVAREEPLEIQLDGRSLAVVMRTPGHDEELALGLLWGERVIAALDDVVSVRHATTAPSPEAADNILHVRLRDSVRVDWRRLQRNLYASASCGICGKATIDMALAAARPLDDDARFASAFFRSLPERMRAAQAGFAETGGLHAAGVFDLDARLLVLREDIGRHNAVDKVVGWALSQGGLPLGGHVLAVSGRISYEIAEKALVAGIPVIAAVSAPSSLAVALAERSKLTLVGFLRGESFNVYGERRRVEP